MLRFLDSVILFRPNGGTDRGHISFINIMIKCLGNYDMILAPRRIVSLVYVLDGMDYGWETSGGEIIAQKRMWKKKRVMTKSKNDGVMWGEKVNGKETNG